MKNLFYFLLIITTLLGTYCLDYFVAHGYYLALLTSQARSFFANPHKAATIEVEVIADNNFQKQDLLTAVVLNSFNQFKQLGIELRLISWRIMTIKPGTERQLAAASEANIVIVLTTNDDLASLDHNWQGLAAYADPLQKLVVITVKDRSLLNSPQLGSTIQHELGHLFYAQHDDDSSAYVMSPVENSSTAWSPAARETITAMKYRF